MYVIEKLQQKYHFKWMFEKFLEYRNTSQYCDVVISVRGVNFEAHRLVLCCSSPYFRILLEGRPMPENIEEQPFELYQLKPQAFEEILQFMYTGAVEINKDNVIEIYKASYFLQVDWLSDVCLRFMRAHIDKENCIPLWKLAGLYSLSRLRTSTCKYASVFLEDIMEINEYLELGITDIKLLLVSTEVSPRLREKVTSAIMRWIQHDEDARKIYENELLTLASTTNTPRVQRNSNTMGSRREHHESRRHGNRLPRLSISECLRICRERNMFPLLPHWQPHGAYYYSTMPGYHSVHPFVFGSQEHFGRRQPIWANMFPSLGPGYAIVSFNHQLYYFYGWQLAIYNAATNSWEACARIDLR